MNMNYINMLEAIKNDGYSNFHDYITDSEITEINNWYNTYSSINEMNMENIIDLLYFLYMRENIDIYPIDEYHHVVNKIAEVFKFHAEKFMEMFIEFRKIVYGFNL